MAYQFADGFDNYGNAFVMVAGYPWDFANNNASTTSTADFRFASPGSLPAGCVSINGNGNVLRKNLSASFSTLIVGFGVKLPSLPISGVVDIVDFWDGGNCQCSLTVSSTGALQMYRANGNPLGGSFNSIATALGSPSATGVIAANTWYGIALQIVIGTGTAGSISVFVNGSSIATLTTSGVNNSGDGVASANQVSLGGPSATSFTIKYDDFYCLDTTGLTLNALLGGDARILTEMPASAGTYTNWTPTGLASNWQNTAVQPPNLSDFNANNVGGTKDSYTTQLASLAIPPYFVVARASMERDDAGPHTPSLFVRSNAVDSPGVVTPALGASYLFYDAVFATDPSTGVAWTGPGADNAQVGVIEG